MNLKLRELLSPLCRFMLNSHFVKQILAQERPHSFEAFILTDFVQGSYGEAYGVTSRDRTRLVQCFERNAREIRSGTDLLIHTILAREILSIAPEAKGDVIECGVWKGASTASLSLVC